MSGTPGSSSTRSSLPDRGPRLGRLGRDKERFAATRIPRGAPPASDGFTLGSDPRDSNRYSRSPVNRSTAA
jgi:hypothetical protein